MLQAQQRTEIPEMTRLVAKTAFPNGSIFMTLRDELGPIFEDERFTHLYPGTGQPSESPARLAMVTIMQFLENLTDRQAAEAVRGRIDWKYGLGLELTDPGFDYSVLSEFRQRLVAGESESLLLDVLLEQCETKGLLGGKKKQRTDSTHILAAVRSLTWTELVGETMRRALDSIAQVAPEWLEQQFQPEWVKRYGRRFDSYRLPKGQAEREALAVTIGADGFQLLEAIYLGPAPDTLRELPILEAMRQIWIQQFYRDGDQIHWRKQKMWGQPPSNQIIASPDDEEARYCVKRATEWVGYKVHFTETCADEHPRLITQVETTAATTHDVNMTEQIQDSLIAKGLGPETQLVDMGYMEADLLVSSQNKGIELVGPVPSSKSWQDRVEEAFDHTQFDIDWQQRVATCPGGKTSIICSDRQTRRGTPNLVFKFSPTDCRPCALRQRCSRAKSNSRTLTVYPQEQYEALTRAREQEKTEEFRQLYAARSGIEGTISQATRIMKVRRSRYIGLERTRLQHVAIAAAINVTRLANWLQGERPAPTRSSPFLELAAKLA
jgi:transposase